MKIWSTMKKSIIKFSLLSSLLFISACSVFPPAIVNKGQNNPTVAMNPAREIKCDPVENCLAIGTLKLEGTGLAVTAKQAGDLLPLWQKIKDSSQPQGNNSPDNQAVYQQIEKLMTDDQLKTIRELTLTPNQIQDLMKNLGIQTTFTPPNTNGQAKGGTPGQGGPEQRPTRDASKTGQPPSQGNNPGMNGRQNRFSERLFLDSVIQLLQKRAAGG